MQRHKYSTSVSIYKSAENSPKGLVSWSIKLSLKFNFPLQETVAKGFKRSCAEAFSVYAHMAPTKLAKWMLEIVLFCRRCDRLQQCIGVRMKVKGQINVAFRSTTSCGFCVDGTTIK